MTSTLDDLSWPRRTERLLIRRAAPSDVDTIWRYRRLEPVARYMTSLPGDLDDFRASFAEPDRLVPTLVVERAGAIIGDLKLDLQDAWAQSEVVEQARGTQAELGWVFDPDHHGHGYATEAVRELLRLCFEDLGIRRVEALCFAANAPSRALMERLGMRLETHAVAESLHRSGEWMDGLGYAMLASEWTPGAADGHTSSAPKA
ncbi:GNAT family N-acetyltransferase [Pseudactinotalea sp.]|uniref:GNAT family N-acetyltransferase n=1 Tax=Pseudactinotalea sp. TaxID=1926260 RepID=UPI003B3A17B6